MRRILFGLAAVLASIVTTGIAAAAPIVGGDVPPFTTDLLDVSAEVPKAAPFDSGAGNGVDVYMIVGVTCPTSRAYAERASQLQQLYGPKDVDFIYVYANRDDTLDQKIGFHRERQLGGRLLDDKGGQIAKKLGARRTSEIFVTNNEGKIVYHGAIDDSRDPSGVKQHYLQTALDETLAGTPVTVSSSQVSA